MRRFFVLILFGSLVGWAGAGTISFVDPEGRLASVPGDVTIEPGAALPEIGEIAIKDGCAKFLLGWYDDAGKQYYDYRGQPILPTFGASGDVTLHPEFFVTGVPLVRELGESDVGAVLTNGLYEVSSGALELYAPTTNTCLSVGEGQTVVIRVNKGCALVVNGGDATNSCGACAGIFVPKSSRLYVIGEGEVTVSGGNAAPGGDGGLYTEPITNGFSKAVEDSYYIFTGTNSAGGCGGNGGGGAGAGIGFGGGKGGLGGAGGSAAAFEARLFDGSESEGEQTFQGANGEAAPEMPEYAPALSELGYVHIVGSVILKSSGGSSAAGGGVKIPDYWGESTEIIGVLGSYRKSMTAARGGCGGSGAGGSAGQGFGLGGAGGGGGGGGGAGGVGRDFHTPLDEEEIVYSKDYTPVGGDGQAGLGLPDDPSTAGTAAGTSESGGASLDQVGGTGGNGSTNVAARIGELWPIYRTGSATISGTDQVLDCDAPKGLTYVITFKDPNGRVKSLPSPVTAVAALPYPSCEAVESAIDNNYLVGWYDEPDGKGTCYFKRKSPTFATYPLTSDVTLYPFVGGLDKIETEICINGEKIPAGASSGQGWSCRNCELLLTGRSEPYVLTGTNEYFFLTIKVKGDSKITFKDMVSDLVSLPQSRGIVEVEPGVSAELTFSGKNILVSAMDGKAGIHCPLGASVTLVADGMDLEMPEISPPGRYRIITSRMEETVHLVVGGGKGAAAIGGTEGVRNGLSGDIVFKDISVFADGGTGAADIGRGVLSGGHTTIECGELTISSGCSVRPKKDTGAGVSFTVDPAPHNQYDLRTWCYRYFDGRMTYRFWLPTGVTELCYTDWQGESSYGCKVTIDAYGNKKEESQ